MLVNGASAVQVGTAFIVSKEANVNENYKNALCNEDLETAVTKSFTGRYARGFDNKFVKEIGDLDVPPYPIQQSLTANIKGLNNVDYSSMWAGQNYKISSKNYVDMYTKDIIDDLMSVTNE